MWFGLSSVCFGFGVVYGIVLILIWFGYPVDFVRFGVSGPVADFFYFDWCGNLCVVYGFVGFLLLYLGLLWVVLDCVLNFGFVFWLTSFGFWCLRVPVGCWL